MGPELIGSLVILVVVVLVAGTLRLQNAVEKRIASRDYSYLLKEQQYSGYTAEQILVGKPRSDWFSAVLEVDDPNGKRIGKIEFKLKKINLFVGSEIFCCEAVDSNFRNVKLYNVRAPGEILAEVVSTSPILGDNEYVFHDSKRKVLVKRVLSGALRSTFKIFSDSAEVGRLENLEGVFYSGSVMVVQEGFSALERLCIFALEFRRLRPES